MPKSTKVTRTTISIDSELMERAQNHAESLGLKFSNYLEMLIEQDIDLIAGEVPIERLAEKYIPARANWLSEKLATADQPRISMRLLDGLSDFIETNGDEVIELMEKYQFSYELHFNKPIKQQGIPKKEKTGYSISAFSKDASKVDED